MAEKKLTEVTAVTSMSTSDSIFANVSSAVRQISLSNLASLIKTIIGSIKNPYSLTFTGAYTGTYDGSSAVTVNIPTGSSGGSSDVTVTQVLTSGTVIATINGTSIYAPSYTDGDEVSY